MHPKTILQHVSTACEARGTTHGGWLANPAPIALERGASERRKRLPSRARTRTPSRDSRPRTTDSLGETSPLPWPEGEGGRESTGSATYHDLPSAPRRKSALILPVPLLPATTCIISCALILPFLFMTEYIDWRPRDIRDRRRTERGKKETPT